MTVMQAVRADEVRQGMKLANGEPVILVVPNLTTPGYRWIVTASGEDLKRDDATVLIDG